MTHPIESVLGRAMRPPTATAAEGGWDGVLEQADRIVARDRRLQRAATLLFVLAIGALAVAGPGGELEIATPADGQDAPAVSPPDRVRSEFLVPGLLLLGVLVGGFVLRMRDRIPSEAIGWRGRLRLIAAPPVLYGPVFLAADVIQPGGPSAVLVTVTVVLKWLTVVALPVVVWLFCERVGDAPNRWRSAALVWLTLGAALTLITRGLIDDVVRVVSGRLWPESFSHNPFDEETARSLESPPGSDWTPANILRVELIAMALLSVACGLLIRAFGTRPKVLAPLLPVAVFLGLGLHALFTPLGFVWDYDPFVGDLVLGGSFAELLFVFAPFDAVGAVAVSSATLSMVCLLWLWGGPRPGGHPQAR